MTRPPLWLGILPTLALAAACTSPDPQTAPEPPAMTTYPAPTSAAPSPDASAWTPEPAPTGQAGQPRGLNLPSTVDDHDPFEVARAFTATVLSYDTAIDASPVDASRRAAQWAAPTYAAALTQDRPGRSGASWTQLDATEGYLSVTFSEHPAVEAGLVTQDPDQLNTEIPLLVTVTATDADLPPAQASVLVALNRTNPDAPWRVYEFIQEDA